ncbi:MAG TPA: hypothetical protein VJJ28_02975, partial [Candidatus Paceibacterota bacterium]
MILLLRKIIERTLYLGIILVVFFNFSFANLAFAENMSSDNYEILSDSVNFSGTRSSSDSYSIEDTVGEIATGDLEAVSNNLHAGYQQATVATTPTATPTATPEPAIAYSGGSGYVSTTSFIVNILNFTAIPLSESILLNWEYPQNSGIVSVMIVRSDKFFPSDIYDGEVIFEGDGKQAIDNDVISGVRYYYAIFAKNISGEYSSGVLAQARIPIAGEIIYKESEDPFSDIPQAEIVHPAISALSLFDFDFIQDGRKIVHQGNTVAIDAKKNLIVQLDYKKVPEILKTIAITLSDPEDSSKVFTFLLRVNKDNTAYTATIASLERSGNYKLNAIILDYKNQGLKRLNGELRAFALGEAKNIFGSLLENQKILYGMISLLLLAFMVIIFFVLQNRKKRNAYIGIILIIISSAGLFFQYAPNAFAAINKEMNYQGKLANSSDTAAVSDGSYNIRFKLYTALTGGSPIWTETWCYSSDSGSTCGGSGTDSRISITSGLFSTMLGSTTALTSVDFNQTLYLGVEIGGSASTPSWDGEMSPRKKLGAVPAAFVADTLDNISSEQFLRADATNSTSTASTFLTFVQNGAGKIAEFFGPSSSSVLSILSGGNLGVGTTTPYARLSVEGSSALGNSALAGYFIATSTTASIFPYASTTAITSSGNSYLGGLILTSLTGSTRCLHVDSSGVVSAATSDCGSGGGSSGGTFSTTTSNVSGQLVNYPNNDTDILN